MIEVSYSRIGQLVDAMCAGPDLNDRGTVIVRAELWNGRVVQGEFYSLPPGQKPDVYHPESDIIWNDSLVLPHAERLAERGDAIVIDAGKSYSAWTMRWSVVA